ncbi:RICIN domain-containing protein [Ruminococcus sp.]|uniref:RICIN domain-containing protein n=1 Tax=Ruminococcus sp. TaxID=41978 RepID=UPI00388EFFF1
MRKLFRRITSVLMTFAIIALMIPFRTISIDAAEVKIESVGVTQKAMFIMDTVNISQGMYGSYSHMGSKAIDLAGRDGGTDPAYAPFDGKVVYMSTSAAYIIYQSLNPVEFADGTVDYMTVWVMHDDNVGRFYVGQTFSQGQHFFNEGRSGYATGNHIHLECAKGTYQGQYKNDYGVWCINNQINPYDALFLSESTTIIDGYGYNWRRTNGSSYGNLGDGFYALITHMASWNHLTNETTGNVDICYENYTANQYWKFYRQSDGSYIIKNAATGKCLEIAGGSAQDGANIQVWDQNNSDAQKWELIPCGNGYQLKAKCTNCVMEMNAWSFYQGVNCVSGGKDGSSAEIFTINKRDFNTVGKTDFSVNTSGADTVFTWGNAWCSTAYNIQIYRGIGTSGNPAISLWNVKNNSFSYHLEDGTYTAYLECFNALGDYVNSTPITFERSLNPSGYVDVGTNFYASISHIASGKYATTQTNGNVNLCSDTNIANQYWKFFRQSDGSYKIKSAFSGKCLEVADASIQDGSNIQVNNENNSSGQNWYIYPCGNGYQLKAKCTTCVMEMNAWSFYEGVNLVSGAKDGSGAEIFAINIKDFNDIGKTNLNVKCQDGKAIFTWEDARCSTAYNIQIWRGNSASGERAYSLWNVKNNSFTYSLDEGTYTAYIECFNAFSDYVNSSPITFKIISYDSLLPTTNVKYNDHSYELFVYNITWTQAKEICEHRGGHLAVINSSEENEALANLASSLSNYVWIGGTDEDSEGSWHWINGDDFSYTNWYSGEPNNYAEGGGSENYMGLLGRTGLWNDAANDNPYISGFICEYDPDELLGDVDVDGEVSIVDATYIQRYNVQLNITIKEKTLLKCGDIDGDGEVSVVDATFIQRYDTMIETPYPIGKPI